MICGSPRYWIWTIVLLSGIITSFLPQFCGADHGQDDDDLGWLSDSTQYYLVNKTVDYTWSLGFMVHWGDNLVRSLAPDGIPWDTVTGALFDESDMESTVQELIMTELPMLITTGILLLLAILLPLVGLFFCCCRLCGNCGGTRKEEEISALNRLHVYLMSPFVILICIIIGICTLLDKPIQTQLVEGGFNFGHTVLYVTYDIETYADDIAKDLKVLAYDDFDGFTEDIMNKLERVGEISNPFVNETLSHFDVVDNQLTTFTNELEMFTLGNEKFSEINDTIYRIISTSENLETALDGVIGNLTQIRDDCYADVVRSGLGVCDPLPDPSSLEVDLDTSQLYLISTSLDPVLIFKSANSSLSSVFNLINKARESVSSVPEIVKNQTKDMRTTVNSSLSDIGRGIKDAVDEATSMMDMDFRDLLQVEMIETELHNAQMEREAYESYYTLQIILRAAFGGFMLVVLCLAGLLFGCCGHNGNIPPSQQNGITNCGGVMSMCSAVWAFLLAFTVCSTAAVLFLMGSNFTLICDDLRDLTIIEEVVDNHALWNGNHPLMNMTGNRNMTFYNLLEQCREDSSVASIFGLTDIIDTDSIDIRSNIPDVEELAGSINTSLAEMSISDEDIQTKIEGLSEQLMPENVADNASSISDVASINLTSTADDLDSQANSIRGSFPDMARSLEGLATRLREIQDEIVDVLVNDTINKCDKLEDGSCQIKKPLLEFTFPHCNITLRTFNPDCRKVLLEHQLEEMNSSVHTLMNHTHPITASVTDLIEFINNDAYESVLEGLETYIDEIVTMSEEFIDESIDQLENEIGRCGIIRLIYDSLVAGICDGFMSGITVAWFCCLLFTLCLIPFICLNVRIAKYHRLPSSSVDQPHHYVPSNKVVPL